MPNIRVKIIALGQKERAIELDENTTIAELRDSNIIGVDDLDSKEIRVNGELLPADTILQNEDTIMITDNPEGGKIHNR